MSNLTVSNSNSKSYVVDGMKPPFFQICFAGDDESRVDASMVDTSMVDTSMVDESVGRVEGTEILGTCIYTRNPAVKRKFKRFQGDGTSQIQENLNSRFPIMFSENVLYPLQPLLSDPPSVIRYVEMRSDIMNLRVAKRPRRRIVRSDWSATLPLSFVMRLFPSQNLACVSRAFRDISKEKSITHNDVMEVLDESFADFPLSQEYLAHLTEDESYRGEKPSNLYRFNRLCKKFGVSCCKRVDGSERESTEEQSNRILSVLKSSINESLSDQIQLVKEAILSRLTVLPQTERSTLDLNTFGSIESPHELLSYLNTEVGKKIVQKVKDLDLTSKRCTFLPVNLINKFVFLYRLNFLDSGILKVPDSVFSSLKKLQYVYMPNDVKLTPQMFQGLPSIRYIASNRLHLDLSAEFIILCRIRDYYLDQFETEQIDEEIKFAPGLVLPNDIYQWCETDVGKKSCLEVTVLEFESMPLTFFPVGFLLKFSNTEYLDLSRMNLDAIPFTLLNIFSKLQSINLENNKITEVPCDIFAKNPQLKRILLKNNPIPKRNKEYIREQFPKDSIEL